MSIYDSWYDDEDEPELDGDEEYFYPGECGRVVSFPGRLCRGCEAET